MTINRRPSYIPPDPSGLRARILANVAETITGCVEWQGSRGTRGYGRVSWHGKYWAVHRVLFAISVHDVDRDTDIDHLCRNPACCKLAHLEAVTRRQNLLRGDTLPARQLARTHCPQGHEFTTKNTHVRPSGRRTCRECDRDRLRRRAESIGPWWRQAPSDKPYMPRWRDQESA